MNLKLLLFALKEQAEYRASFIFWLFWMIFNEFLFFAVFFLFTLFLKWWITPMDFLLSMSFYTFYFWIVHWIFWNIWSLPQLIESWKIDYYLSFPISPLRFLTLSKINVSNLWEILFSVSCALIYFSVNSWNFLTWIWWIFEWLILIFFWSVFSFWLFLAVWSISFFLDKWSFLSDIHQWIFFPFWTYPPQIFRSDLILFSFISVIWIYSSCFLPYEIIRFWGDFFQWWLMIFSSFLSLILWIFIFNKWLKNYSSWNLVNQM